MTNEPVDTASKERTIQHYCRILTPPQLNHWQVTLSFCFNYSHVLSVNHHYIQRIVQATSPLSMNVGGVVQKFLLCKVSNIRSHSLATTNQHLCCSKERKWDTKVSPCIATVDGEKHLLGLSNNEWWKKRARSTGNCCVMLVWRPKGIRQSVS